MVSKLIFGLKAIFKDKFCWCGHVATKQIKGLWFCDKHDKLKTDRSKIGKYSGKSKSENKFNDYK